MSETIPYFQRLKQIKLGLLDKEAVAKPRKPIAKVSEKKKAQDKAEKELRNGDSTEKEKWFQARRREMVGTCQCGCSEKSSKYDNDNFRSSIAHIFPQRYFESIQFHKLNWVERKVWATSTSSSCHSNMDLQSMDLWIAFADWDDIKERFHELAPLLTNEERATKFYSKLETLVYSN